MTGVFSFDPGEKRTGIAVYLDRSIYCLSREPWAAVTYLYCHPPEIIKHVLLEQWVPYPGASHGNAWRDLIEVKTLGALEWVCRSHGLSYSYSQTSTLEPTMALASAAGYPWQAANRDEKAAEAHLYYYQHLREL